MSGTIYKGERCNVSRDEQHHFAPDRNGLLMCIWCKQYLKENVKVETKNLDPEGEAEIFNIHGEK